MSHSAADGYQLQGDFTLIADGSTQEGSDPAAGWLGMLVLLLDGAVAGWLLYFFYVILW